MLARMLMSLVSSVQLASLREGYTNLWGRAGSEASQRVLHQIIYLAGSTIVSKPYFLWIYSLVTYFWVLTLHGQIGANVLSTFFSITVCTGTCSLKDIICTTKRDISHTYIFEDSCHAWATTCKLLVTAVISVLQKSSCCSFLVLWADCMYCCLYLQQWNECKMHLGRIYSHS